MSVRAAMLRPSLKAASSDRDPYRRPSRANASVSGYNKDESGGGGGELDAPDTNGARNIGPSSYIGHDGDEGFEALGECVETRGGGHGRGHPAHASWKLNGKWCARALRHNDDIRQGQLRINEGNSREHRCGTNRRLDLKTCSKRRVSMWVTLRPGFSLGPRGHHTLCSGEASTPLRVTSALSWHRNMHVY
jgi:hypothetical protein